MSGGLQTLLTYVTTDELVARIERYLRRQGAGFDDIDERIAAELGVPVQAWSGYLAVKRAADRYQAAAGGPNNGSRQIRRNGGQRK